MIFIKKYTFRFGFILFALLLTACANQEDSITIEAYEMDEDERALIDKTGVDQMEYFNITGTVEDGLDLQFAVEIYENGDFTEELFSTEDAVEKEFTDSLISFGIHKMNQEDSSFLNVVASTSSAVISANYTDDSTSSSTGVLIDEEITLETNKPTYLVAWVGTNKDHLRSIKSEKNGGLPVNLEEVEQALLFKVLLTDDE